MQQQLGVLLLLYKTFTNIKLCYYKVKNSSLWTFFRALGFNQQSVDSSLSDFTISGMTSF